MTWREVVAAVWAVGVLTVYLYSMAAGLGVY